MIRGWGLLGSPCRLLRGQVSRWTEEVSGMKMSLPGINSFQARRVSGLKKSDVLYGAKVWLILNVVICVGTEA